MTQITPASLQKLLENPTLRQHVIGRALVVLFERQTATEKSSNATHITNGVGFAQADARSGTITAKYYLKHKKLEDWQVEKWMKAGKNGNPRIVKYWRQLNEAAQEKATKKAAQQVSGIPGAVAAMVQTTTTEPVNQPGYVSWEDFQRAMGK